MQRRVLELLAAMLAGAAAFSPCAAQLRTLKVVSADSLPIAFAFVTIGGGTGQITDERGRINLGAGRNQTITVNVRRIGFQPWFGKVALPDSAAVLTVTLQSLAQTLSQVRVTGAATAPSLSLNGFYDRWLMRQQGTLSAVFIGRRRSSSGIRTGSPTCSPG